MRGPHVDRRPHSSRDGFIVALRLLVEYTLFVVVIGGFPAVTKGLSFFRRRPMHLVRVVEGLRPQLPTPMFGEPLGTRLVRNFLRTVLAFASTTWMWPSS